MPEEKRLRIINAGFEVFSQSDYRHASTERLAAQAGISKGLLFYYFHNKKALYLFLFEYAEKLLRENVVDARFSEISDLFDLFDYAARRKYQLLQQNPYIMDFVVRAFGSHKEDVSEDLNKKLQVTYAELFSTYFSNIDDTKFRDDIDPMDVIQMLFWIADGYMHERQRNGQKIELEEFMEKFRFWEDIFKKISYKEEYLNERSH